MSTNLNPIIIFFKFTSGIIIIIIIIIIILALAQSRRLKIKQWLDMALTQV